MSFGPICSRRMLGLFGSNVQLWVHKKPYPKSINVRCISNYISKFPSFVIVQQFLCHLKIYYNAKQVDIIVDDKNILGWSMVFHMFIESNERSLPM